MAAPKRKTRRGRPKGGSDATRYDRSRRLWVDGDYWFDKKAADRAARFFPDNLRLTTGEWSGRPFVLQSWQEEDIIRPMFGWKRPDGTRRFRRVYVWIARKNGKTELAAGIALLMLVGDAEPGGQVYSIATDKDQASIVFNKAAAMVGKSEVLAEDLVCFKPSIYCPALNASFKPLSGKPTGKHGLDTSGLVGDEIHEWPSGELYQFVHDSQSARRQPLEFMISTAGKKGGYGEDVWDECIAIQDGAIEDPETLVVIYAADPDDDWTDEAVWRKANPNLGVSKKLDVLRTDCRRARQLPRLVNDFKRYQLNMWTDQATLWLPLDAVNDTGRKFGWDHCVGPTDWKALEDELDGLTCYGGLDLSSTQDLSALVWWFPIQDGLDFPVCLCRFYKPEDLLDDHGKRDKLNYRRWMEDGALFATPGNVIDYDFIQEQIIADATRFNVAHTGDIDLKQGEGGLAIDRWNATQTAVQLRSEGLPVALFGQGYQSMSAPSKALEGLVMSNGFHHGGHPILRQHAKVVAVVSDPADNIKPAKNKSSQRIDGIVALVMAIGLAQRDEGDDTLTIPDGYVMA